MGIYWTRTNNPLIVVSRSGIAPELADTAGVSGITYTGPDELIAAYR